MIRQFKKPYTSKRRISRKDFSHWKTLGVLGAPPVPNYFNADTRVFTQTGNTCTANAAVAIREAMLPKKYDPNLQWRSELDFMGVTEDANGATLDTQLAVCVKVGFFEENGVPAPIDRASAYFFVHKNPGMDWFDSVCTALRQLYAKYGKVIPLSLGVNWYSDWDGASQGIIPNVGTTMLGGHDLKVSGIESLNGTDYIRIQNSWGTSYGDNGFYRVSREVFNKYFDVYGAGYIVDDPDVNVQRYGLLGALLENLKNLLQAIMRGFAKTTPSPIVPDEVVPTPIIPVPIVPDLQWGNPQQCETSVRSICESEGMSPSDTEEIVATLYCESGMNPKQVNVNPNKTSDFGIAQFNSYWFIGPDKEIKTPDEALNNPEKCVRIMCHEWQRGGKFQWTCYKTGRYKQFYKGRDS